MHRLFLDSKFNGKCFCLCTSSAHGESAFQRLQPARFKYYCSKEAGGCGVIGWVYPTPPLRFAHNRDFIDALNGDGFPARCDNCHKGDQAIAKVTIECTGEISGKKCKKLSRDGHCVYVGQYGEGIPGCIPCGEKSRDGNYFKLEPCGCHERADELLRRAELNVEAVQNDGAITISHKIKSALRQCPKCCPEGLTKFKELRERIDQAEKRYNITRDKGEALTDQQRDELQELKKDVEQLEQDTCSFERNAKKDFEELKQAMKSEKEQAEAGYFRAQNKWGEAFTEQQRNELQALKEDVKQIGEDTCPIEKDVEMGFEKLKQALEYEKKLASDKNLEAQQKKDHQQDRSKKLDQDLLYVGVAQEIVQRLEIIEKKLETEGVEEGSSQWITYMGLFGGLFSFYASEKR